MKIAAAQIKPIEQNTDANIQNHLRMIELAAQQNVELIVFPEMSLTGYVMEQANELSFSENDLRIGILKEKAELYKMIIVAGAPIKINSDLFIGLFILFPDGTTSIYTKQFLHTGEEKYFSPSFAHNPLIKLNLANHQSETISLAICADITNPLHPENASKNNTSLYIASIFYTPKGIAEAYQQLSSYAKKYSMNILMANFCGSSYQLEAAGQSACWNKKGELMKQLNSQEENLLVVEI